MVDLRDTFVNMPSLPPKSKDYTIWEDKNKFLINLIA